MKEQIVIKNTSTIERNYFNSLKGFLIVLVVIGHFGQTISNLLPGIMSNVVHGFVLFIYSFHMPLFMFVSGYLSKNLEKRRDKAFEELMIPYLVFQILVGGAYYVFDHSPEAISNIFIPQMGAWYLMSLFIYRVLMPNLSKVRGIFQASVLINILICLSDNIGSVISLDRTLGFFIFFLLGYYARFEHIVALKKRISKVVAIGVLLLIVFGIIMLINKVEYSLCFSVLLRSANVTDFDTWYTAVAAYIVAFIFALVIGVFVMVALPVNSNICNHFGEDTMPMYLSHLIVFLACAFLVGEGNWVIASAISFLAMIGCLVVFSTDRYKKGFNHIFS